MGLDETRDAMRTFKIERIVDLRVTNDRFDAPDAGDLERVLRRAWDIIGDQDEVTVVLRFAPSVAARVQEATWHPTQAVREEADGSLRWTARVAGTIEVRLWVLSWGDEVEVLEPTGAPRRRHGPAAEGPVPIRGLSIGVDAGHTATHGRATEAVPSRRGRRRSWNRVP